MTREPELDWSLSLRPPGQAPWGSDRDYELCSLISISQISCAQPIIVMAAEAGRGHRLHYCDSGFYAADTQGRDQIHKGLFHSTKLSLSVLGCCSVYAPVLFMVNLWVGRDWFHLWGRSKVYEDSACYEKAKKAKLIMLQHIYLFMIHYETGNGKYQLHQHDWKLVVQGSSFTITSVYKTSQWNHTYLVVLIYFIYVVLCLQPSLHKKQMIYWYDMANFSNISLFFFCRWWRFLKSMIPCAATPPCLP